MEAASAPVKGYACEFIDPVPENLYCNSCSLVARKLTFTSCCTESYCYACLAGSLRVDQSCPACGKETCATINPLKYVRQLESIRAYCTLKERGCDWSGTLEHLDSHLDSDKDLCQYMDTKCPLNCQQTIPKNRVEQHVNEECAKRDFTCQHCAFKATYEEVLNTHLPECKYVPIPCPNRCGVTCEREDSDNHLKTCRYQEIACIFGDVGCDERFIREHEEEHMTQNSLEHLFLTATATVQSSQATKATLHGQHLEHEKLKITVAEMNRSFVEDHKQAVQCGELQEDNRKLQEDNRRCQERSEKLEQRIRDQAELILGLQERLKEQGNKVGKLEQLVCKFMEEQHSSVQHLEDKSQASDKALSKIERMVGLKRTFAMENFTRQKAKDKPNDWKSPAMYTHVCGYKFSIGIDANGYGSAHGNSVCASLWAVSGEYDQHLKWPAQANFTLELLIQKRGENVRISSDKMLWEKPKQAYEFVHTFFFKQSVTLGFIEHDKLGDFLIGDMLKFTISDVKVY